MVKLIPFGEVTVEVDCVRMGEKVELRIVAVLNPEQLLEFLDDLRVEVEEAISQIEKATN